MLLIICLLHSVVCYHDGVLHLYSTCDESSCVFLFITCVFIVSVR